MGITNGGCEWEARNGVTHVHKYTLCLWSLGPYLETQVQRSVVRNSKMSVVEHEIECKALLSWGLHVTG